MRSSAHNTPSPTKRRALESELQEDPVSTATAVNQPVSMEIDAEEAVHKVDGGSEQHMSDGKGAELNTDPASSQMKGVCLELFWLWFVVCVCVCVLMFLLLLFQTELLIRTHSESQTHLCDARFWWTFFMFLSIVGLTLALASTSAFVIWCRGDIIESMALKHFGACADDCLVLVCSLSLSAGRCGSSAGRGVRWTARSIGPCVKVCWSLCCCTSCPARLCWSPSCCSTTVRFCSPWWCWNCCRWHTHSHRDTHAHTHTHTLSAWTGPLSGLGL